MTPTMTSTPTATKTPETTQAVLPLLECVEATSNGFVAHFGYYNSTDTVVSIPIGTENRFSPDPKDRGQIELFEPDRSPAYPNAAFNVPFLDGMLEWTLGDVTVRADSEDLSTRCNATPGPSL
jgi:hypothetical protein